MKKDRKTMVEKDRFADYGAATEALKADYQVKLACGEPVWLEHGDQFALSEEDVCYIYDPETGRREVAFSRAKINTAVNNFLGRRMPAKRFDLGPFEFADQDKALKIVFEDTFYRIRLKDYKVSKIRAIPKIEGIAIQTLSPDEKLIAFIEDYNVHIRPVKGGKAIRLTTDGTKDNAYLGSDDTNCYQMMGPLEKRWCKQIFLWSPDSKSVAVYQVDQARVQTASLLDNSVSPAELKTLRYAYPGADEVFRFSLSVIDIQTGTTIPIKFDPVDHQILYYLDWDPGGEEIYYIGVNRAHNKMDLMAFNPEAGDSRIILNERYDTHIEDTYIMFRWLPDSQRFVWASERDGWNHLYLYQKDGQCLNQITRGEFPVSTIVSFHEDNETLYFLAAQDSKDPYYQHLFKVNLSGQNQRKLTQTHAMHSAYPSPSSRFFVIQYSAPDMPPQMDLIDNSGKTLKTLTRSDISAWLKAGWRFPEAFNTTAADGITPLFGLMYKPRNFDASKRYPLIEYVYPGPITYTTPKIFTPNDKNQALSELGFIVIVMDGRGTLGRGKAFQDFSYGRFGQYELVDHVEAIKQLGRKYPFINTSKVGIYGRSAGGYAAARGLLQYPHVYHVGVSLSGHHDYRRYMWYWVEQYCGHPEENQECYIDQANISYAKNLTGKLLLIHGAMDDNVFPDHTIQLADALIKQKKIFDICLIPRQRHDYVGIYDDYCTRKTWDYFVDHLV